MKIILFAIALALFTSSCSQINKKQSESQLDERIRNSEFSTEYRLIKEIIADPDVLIEKDYVSGCISDYFNDYNDDIDIFIDGIDDYYNTSDVIIIKEYSNKYYHEALREYVEFLVIHIKMPEHKYGITFDFDRVGDKWCLSALRIYPPIMWGKDNILLDYLPHINRFEINCWT